MNNDSTLPACLDDIDTTKLQKEANGGNLEAMKLCIEIAEKKRFIDLVNNMDEDELAL